MMAERGIALAHTTILGWYNAIFRTLKSAGVHMCDQLLVPGVVARPKYETYIKVKGRWRYLYRAVDKQGNTVDFLLSERRDVAEAKRFFRKAIKNNGTPRVLTLDAHAASHRAIAELKAMGIVPGRERVRSSKYLNNVVEQDHRRMKQRIRPMLRFKRFDTAAVTIAGIELAEKIKKDQFKIGKRLEMHRRQTKQRLERTCSSRRSNQAERLAGPFAARTGKHIMG
jgi:transposase-like protein